MGRRLEISMAVTMPTVKRIAMRRLADTRDRMLLRNRFQFPGFGETSTQIGHCFCFQSAGVNGRFHVHTGAQHQIRIPIRSDQDFHRNALNHLDEIACRESS